jgi:hypothetical protein
MTTKTATCDGCGKESRDVQSCGKDANGEPDAPDLCFVCRKEGARGRVFDRKAQKYVEACHFDHNFLCDCGVTE